MYKWTVGALSELHEGSEARMITILEKVNLAAIHAGEGHADAKRGGIGDESYQTPLNITRRQYQCLKRNHVKNTRVEKKVAERNWSL